MLEHPAFATDVEKDIRILPDQCEILCTCAEAVLSSICEKTLNGQITLDELCKMRQKNRHVELLFEESSPQRDEVRALQQALKERHEERDEFIKYLEKLGQLCQSILVQIKGIVTIIHICINHYFSLFCISPNRVGLDQLKKEIDMLSSNGDAPINTLCKRDRGNRITFIALKTASPLNVITNDYDIMSRRYPTRLFIEMWNAHMRTAVKSQPQLSIQSIKTDIWDPCFQECQTLLNSLRDRTILLSRVDHYFQGVQDIKTQLCALHAGVRLCAPEQNNKKDIPHICSAVDHIEKYWSLCRLAIAAEIVMDLKEKLVLTGDFSLIESLAEEVNDVFLIVYMLCCRCCCCCLLHQYFMFLFCLHQKKLAYTGRSHTSMEYLLVLYMQVTSSMHSRPLSSIGDDLIKAGEFLEQFADPQKVECLQIFSRCINIVKWIQKATKGNLLFLFFPQA